MANVAFISSSIEYTQGILSVTNRLETLGFSVYWISHRRYEMHWLRRQNIPSEKILETTLPREAPQYAGADLDARLSRIDDGRPPFVNDIILMDRILRRKTYAFARRYLAHVEERVTAFLVENRISLVSSGRDTALQLVSIKLCAGLGIPCVKPVELRIPDNRFGFCLGHTEATFVPIRATMPADRVNARRLLADFRTRKPVPSASIFERRNGRLLRRVPSDLILGLKAVARGVFDRGNDYTRYPLPRLWVMFWRRRLKAMHVRMAPVFNAPETRPYLLYAYQMQPESSVDVLASYFWDQKAVITQISRSMPSGYDLYVRPHPDHIGGLSRSDLLQLKRIPSVRLISPDINHHDLIQRAAVVFTLSGTMAMEAGLHKIPAVVFAPMFFGALPTVRVCDSPLKLPALIQELLSLPKLAADDELEEFLASLFANSFEGRITTYLGPFTETEIESYTAAYYAVHERLRHVAPALQEPREALR